MAKKVLMVMDSSGDSRTEFDETDAASTQEAKALFDKLTDQGAAVFTIGKDQKKVTRFEDLAEENVAVPAIVGG